MSNTHIDTLRCLECEIVWRAELAHDRHLYKYGRCQCGGEFVFGTKPIRRSNMKKYIALAGIAIFAAALVWLNYQNIVNPDPECFFEQTAGKERCAP